MTGMLGCALSLEQERYSIKGRMKYRLNPTTVEVGEVIEKQKNKNRHEDDRNNGSGTEIAAILTEQHIIVGLELPHTTVLIFGLALDHLLEV